MVGEWGTAVGSALLWTVMGLFLAGTLYWGYEMLRFGVYYRPPQSEYGAGDVQVRILTIDNESVVRRTVEALPDELEDCYVVAEEPLDVPGATVAVVPDDFECDATNKGRALEWARRTLPCDREFVLYLDEDSHVREFDGLPDADVVQLRERPRRTTSLLCYLADLARIGFQVEQRAFPELDVPLYAWGGGLAVRKSLEDAVTWDYATVIEDTVFLWRAHVLEDADYAFVPTRVSNQAPPGLVAMFRQRRRWIAGAREDNDVLSLEYVLMYGVRDLSWAVTGLIPVVTVASFTPGVGVVFVETYRVLSVALFGVLYLWVGIALVVYPQPLRVAAATLLFAPVTTVLHSVGALWGVVSTPGTFEVTEKVVEDDVDPTTQTDATPGRPNARSPPSDE